ncbi:Ppx/GppA phosphatase family protein [Campylobacter pinnipediorum]|uniref:Ppx/GppA phosphatase family protein n=1 Tax=Campylobacter pinnipediorum TaxID=1965231 RepID=UPI00084D945A|nr:Ppx/GppA phosphatase family protein [Campylobacter pinnipediorum]AQW80908.1 guanosine-5'-triphosphate, 3'-diphosphate pyrophosphatase [Campylobacter pinnipediorum subsp. pinnipediorum]
MAKRTAVIDLGSNSTRMVIFERTSRWAFFTLGEYKMKVRLGEGGYANNGNISQESMDTAFEAFSEFKNIATSYKCNKILAVGTSALRDAPNSKTFINLIKNKLKINLKIINGDDEAKFGALAAINLLCIPNHCVTLDIGGGSSELALIKDLKIVKTISLDIGTVRLKELFNNTDNKEELDIFIKKITEKIPSEFKSENIVVIGGSLRALSTAIMKKINYPLPSIHGFCYEIEKYHKFISNISTSKKEELEQFNIKKDRFDTIREGALIFLNIIKHLNIKSVYTSCVGIREGIFLSNFLRPSLKFPSNLNPSLKSLQDRFILTNNKNIAFYSKEIFKELSPLHNLNEKYLYELTIASKLYNAGQDIGFYNDHISSAYIIQNALNFGFKHEEKALISAIISTNGKKNVYEYEKFKPLLPKQSHIRWLSFILALAKTLDINCSSKKLCFKFENQTLRIFGSKNLMMAKEEIKKLNKPEPFAISFE